MRRVILVFGFLFLFSGAIFGEQIAGGYGMFHGGPAAIMVTRSASAQNARTEVELYRAILLRDRAWDVLSSDTLVLGMNFVDIAYGARRAVLGTSAAVPGEITVVNWNTRFGNMVVLATYAGNGIFFGFMAEVR